MLIPIHGLKLFAHCSTLIEALCSLLYMVYSFTLIVIHGVKLHAHCNKCSEVMCSLLYME